MARMAKKIPRERINLLHSWKEIAAYLDCDRRTCLRWEKAYGLPVHRLKKQGRSTVFSSKDEIDQWLENRLKSSNSEKSPAAFFECRGYKRLILVSAFLTGGLGYLALSPFLRAGRPADFSIAGSQFIIRDAANRKVFRYDSGIENISEEEQYRARFQYRRKNGRMGKALPHLIIKDLDSNDAPEVLLSIQTQNEHDEGNLICFDSQGNIEWEFQAGRERVFGERHYSRDYRIYGFDVHDIDRDGDLEIFVISHHLIDFPCQVAVLSHRGELLGEYWHAGQLVDMVFHDIDGDGGDEVLLAGLNNEYREGVLIAFDPERISGASPQAEGRFLCRGAEPGSERFYMRFPRTDLDLLEYPMEAIISIGFLENGIISLGMKRSGILFEVDSFLNPVSVTFSNDFRFNHGNAVSRGALSSSLDNTYVQTLLKGIRYFDGWGWVSQPTAVAASGSPSLSYRP